MAPFLRVDHYNRSTTQQPVISKFDENLSEYLLIPYPLPPLFGHGDIMLLEAIGIYDSGCGMSCFWGWRSSSLTYSYHAGKYSMAPSPCSVKSLEIAKKIKSTNGLDEGSHVQYLKSFWIKRLALQEEQRPSNNKWAGSHGQQEPVHKPWTYRILTIKICNRSGVQNGVFVSLRGL